MEEHNYTYEEAVELIKKNGNLFENGYPTEISDYEFDGLLQLVNKVTPNFDWRQYVVYEADGKERKHEISYRDFEKNYDINWYDTTDKYNELNSKYAILPKFDGSSVVIYLKNGKVDFILSKSDKEWGFIQTKKLRAKAEIAIRDRLQLDMNEKIEDVKAICCEATCNKENGGRSQANGCINSKYLQESVDKFIELLPWDIVFNDGHKHCNGYYALSEDKFNEIRTTGYLSFEDIGLIPCDGVVCYNRDINDTKLFIQKIYMNEVIESEVTDVTWSISDYGLLHPVTEFNTVVFEDGRTVERVNSYNVDQLHDMKIVKGSKIKLGLAGGAIPTYAETSYTPANWEDEFSKQTKEVYPNFTVDLYDHFICPECGAKLYRCGSSSDLICSNPHCRWWEIAYLNRLFPNDLDYINGVIAMDNGDTKGVIELVVKNSNSSFHSGMPIESLLSLISFQRLSDAKWEKIVNSTIGPNDEYDFLTSYKSEDVMAYIDKHITPNISDRQWEYMIMQWDKLIAFLQML